LYGAFVLARRALNRPKRRFLARAGERWIVGNGGHWWAKIPADGAAAYPAVAVMTVPRVVTMTKTRALRYEPFAGVASMRHGPAFELTKQLQPGDVLDITEQLLQSKGFAGAGTDQMEIRLNLTFSAASSSFGVQVRGQTSQSAASTTPWAAQEHTNITVSSGDHGGRVGSPEAEQTLRVSSTIGTNVTADRGLGHTWSPSDDIEYVAPLCELPTDVSHPVCTGSPRLSTVEMIIIVDHCVAEVYAYEGASKGGPVITSGMHVSQNGNATRLLVPSSSGGLVTVELQAWRLDFPGSTEEHSSLRLVKILKTDDTSTSTTENVTRVQKATDEASIIAPLPGCPMDYTCYSDKDTKAFVSKLQEKGASLKIGLLCPATAPCAIACGAHRIEIDKDVEALMVNVVRRKRLLALYKSNFGGLILMAVCGAGDEGRVPDFQWWADADSR
jgi:hypothetical protein